MLEDPSLLNIGDSVGKAVRVDPNTIDMIRGRYARICVELSLDTPLMPTMVVWGKKYSVEYEGLHKIYFRCGCYGHKMEYCSKNPNRVSEEPTRGS